MEACGFENSRSLLVAGLALRSGMLAPVNLDNQMDRVTVEVQDVASHGLLPSELGASERAMRRPLTVPPVKEVLSKLAVDGKRAQKILLILLRERVLVKVTEDLIFHRTAMEALRGKLTEYKKKNGERLPIAAFKELSGVSRKYAIPLLEFLDRERVTRRVGDERVIQ